MTKITKPIMTDPKPAPSSFYLLGKTIYYNTQGVDHPKLWKLIVPVAFPGLPLDLRLEVLNSVYGTERGRVTWTGKFVDGKPTGKGQFALYGTPACEAHEETLKDLFGLSGLSKNRIRVDFKTDQHYRTVRADIALIAETEKWCKPACGAIGVAHASKDLKFVKLED